MTTADDLLPVGLEDALPDRARKITSAMRAVLDAMDGHGYDRVRPPLVEFEQSLAGRMDGVATRRMVRFTDPDSLRTLALRSDITVQIGRIAATGMAHAPRPLRLSRGAAPIARHPSHGASYATRETKEATFFVAFLMRLAFRKKSEK